MTKQEMKNKLNAAIANDDKATIMQMLNPLIEKLSMMLIQGVLLKNVKAHLSNNGITGKACDMITEMASIRAENFAK